MLSVLTSGLSLVAMNLLKEALNSAFGEGTVEIIKLDKDNLRQRVRLSQRNVADGLVVLEMVSKDMCSDIENG